MQRLRRHRGVTLIEAVLFISIAMGIIVGGLQFYQQAALALRTEQTVRLATALVAESRSLYRSTRIPDALARVRIDPVLDAAGSVPGNARSGNPAAPINSAWGDPVTLSSGLARLDGSEGPLSVQIAFVDMPTTICTRLLHHDASGTGPLGAGLVEVGIVETATGNVVLSHDVETGGALPPAEAGTLCRQGGDGTTVVLSFAWRGG